MRNYADLRSRLLRVCAALTLAVTAGCASAPAPLLGDAAPAPPSVVEPQPAAAPPPVPPPRPAPPERAAVVLLVDDSATSYAELADAIAASLPGRRYRVTRLTDDSTELAERGQHAAAVVAVGRAAVQTAQRVLPGIPTVFCQVLRHEDLLVADRSLWGIAAWPPAAASLAAWRAVDPGVRTILLIVSDLDSPLAAEARAAAAAQGVDLRIERSSSDRETLYLFRRSATTIDGLWLLPDDRAFGPTTLREILRYATARGVGVLAFSEALLRHGALLSATSVPTDVAATVHAVVERIASGRTTGLTALTPLSAVELTVNGAVAEALGLRAPAAPRWVVREPD